MVPKVPGGIAPEQQRPICLQVVALKWMSAVILAQLQDFLRLVIPPQQEGFVQGRSMVDLVIRARAGWEEGRQGA